MRPDNIRRSIVIYCRWQNPDNGLIKPFRRVLTDVFYSEQKNTIAQKTGIVLNESIFCQIFNQPDLAYVPLHEWQKLSGNELDGKWTVDIVPPQSFIVPFIIEHEFEWGDSAAITRREDTFINATPGANRIASMEDNRRGSERAQHISMRM